MKDQYDRRTLLKTTGAALTAGLAGCLGGDGREENGNAPEQNNTTNQNTEANSTEIDNDSSQHKPSENGETQENNLTGFEWILDLDQLEGERPEGYRDGAEIIYPSEIYESGGQNIREDLDRIPVPFNFGSIDTRNVEKMARGYLDTLVASYNANTDQIIQSLKQTGLEPENVETDTKGWDVFFGTVDDITSYKQTDRRSIRYAAVKDNKAIFAGKFSGSVNEERTLDLAIDTLEGDIEKTDNYRNTTEDAMREILESGDYSLDEVHRKYAVALREPEEYEGEKLSGALYLLNYDEGTETREKIILDDDREVYDREIKQDDDPSI